MTLRYALPVVPAVYKIKNVQSIAGNQVVVHRDPRPGEGRGSPEGLLHGDGPVRAMVKAVNRITGIEGSWPNLPCAASPGAGRRREVFMKVDFDKASFVRKAPASTLSTPAPAPTSMRSTVDSPMAHQSPKWLRRA